MCQRSAEDESSGAEHGGERVDRPLGPSRVVVGGGGSPSFLLSYRPRGKMSGAAQWVAEARPQTSEGNRATRRRKDVRSEEIPSCLLEE
jgi:hypothetical protein